MTEDHRLYVNAVPLAWSIPMRQEDHYHYGAMRCVVKVEDVCGGPYLTVEFFNDDPANDDSEHAGFFNDHQDIDRFARHLHSILATAEAANE